MSKSFKNNIFKRKPDWLKVKIPAGDGFSKIKKRVLNLNLNTVCEEANCPNIGVCWNGGTATFMMMGDICTRGCRFCSVNSGNLPRILNPEEPKNLADAVKKMDLKYVVFTTVDRDDLPDQGANHIANCILHTKKTCPDTLIEILMPDFQGKKRLIKKVINSKPAVLAHNIETVRRLSSKVRDPRANYDQSLQVLDFLKKQSRNIYTKSSLMLGLGESRNEILDSMKDLRNVSVDFLTIGQYLQPTKKQLKVEEYIHPDKFKEFAKIGEKMGFKYVASGPLVRSSYKAAEFYIEKKIKENL